MPLQTNWMRLFREPFCRQMLPLTRRLFAMSGFPLPFGRRPLNLKGGILHLPIWPELVEPLLARLRVHPVADLLREDLAQLHPDIHDPRGGGVPAGHSRVPAGAEIVGPVLKLAERDHVLCVLCRARAPAVSGEPVPATKAYLPLLLCRFLV